MIDFIRNSDSDSAGSYLDMLPDEILKTIAHYLNFRSQFNLEHTVIGFKAPIRDKPNVDSGLSPDTNGYINQIDAIAKHPKFPMVAIACQCMNKCQIKLFSTKTEYKDGDNDYYDQSPTLMSWHSEYRSNVTRVFALDWSPCGRYLALRRPRNYYLIIIDLFENETYEAETARYTHKHEPSDICKHDCSKYYIVPLMSMVFAKYLVHKDMKKYSITWPKRDYIFMAVDNTRRHGRLHHIRKTDPTPVTTPIARGRTRRVNPEPYVSYDKSRDITLPTPAIAFHPCFKTYATSYDGERVAIFNMYQDSGCVNGMGFKEDPIPDPNFILPVFPGKSRSWIHSLSWSPCGNYLAIFRMNGLWYIWSILSGRYVYVCRDYGMHRRVYSHPHVKHVNYHEIECIENIQISWEPTCSRYLAVTANGVPPVIWDSVTYKAITVDKVVYPPSRDTSRVDSISHDGINMVWFHDCMHLLFVGDYSDTNHTVVIYDVPNKLIGDPIQYAIPHEPVLINYGYSCSRYCNSVILYPKTADNTFFCIILSIYYDDKNIKSIPAFKYKGIMYPGYKSSTNIMHYMSTGVDVHNSDHMKMLCGGNAYIRKCYESNRYGQSIIRNYARYI